jgi:tight adherence protein C
MSDFLASLAGQPEALALAGLGLGVLVAFYGLSGAFAGQSAEVRRMRATAGGTGADRSDLIDRSDTDPKGIFKVFVPASGAERTRVARKMRQAGIYRPGAVRSYYFVRGALGLLLPSLLVGLLFLPEGFPLPPVIADVVADLGWAQTFQVLTVLLVLGFYGPSLWLKSRIDERRRRIEQGLPNALDMLQVAVEAGMGFDAAMNRVAHEMARVVPPIAEEFMTVQLEIQAGMERQRAFLNLAERTGVDEMSAFANVVLQSAQFGSSISAALSVYADEMRLSRELKAQERANKLPVKMSGVMALLMMPTLLLITLTPVVIRLVRMFA